MTGPNKRCLAILALTATLAAGEAVSFTAKPSVAKAGGQTTIAFAVSAPTDVEVAIVDGKGAVVRHLAAGVLGGQEAPPAPLQAGLAQKLTWDGLDDHGKPATGASVRIRAGMGVKLAQIVGGDPYAYWSEHSFQGDHAQWHLLGLEAKPDGKVYVLASVTSYALGPALRQYDARGTYCRTLFPPAAGRPAEEIRGWGLNVRPDGNYALQANFGWCTATPDWPLLSMSGPPHLLPTREPGILCLASQTRAGNRQMTVGTDGTLRSFEPAPVIDGDPIPGGEPFFSALSPDGQHRYISGRFAGIDKKDAAGPWRNGQVWKVDVATRKASLFFALDAQELTPDRSGHGAANPYGALHGLAVDAEGRVFVCDRQNARIAVLGPDGKLVRSIPLQNPDAIATQTGTKCLYVTTRTGTYSGQGELRLLKFADWSKGETPSAIVILRGGMGKFRECSRLAVAVDKRETLVWVASTELPVRIYRDAGAKLELVKDFYEAGPQRALDLQFMCLDQATGDAYIADSQSFLWRIRDWANPQFELCRIDPKAKAPAASIPIAASGPARIGASSVAIDAQRRLIYTLNHYNKPMLRWRIDGDFFTPMPGEEAGVTPPITCSWIFTGLGPRGIAVAPDGGVATLGAVESDRKGWYTDYSGPLHFFKPDAGRRPWPSTRFEGLEVFSKHLNTGGVRFDPRGNLYVGICDGQAGQVPPGYEKDKDFAATMGRIYKFAPTGSVGDLFPTSPTAPAKIYDVQCGPFAPESRGPRFGVDAYGRIYYPTGLLPQISVVDNAGKRILSFGTYGNRDSLGGLPGDLVPTRDIPLGWPNSVDATDDHIVVTDILNLRLLRLAKTFAASESVALK